MKLFQKLLLAPAALGLLAPVAANAADVNIAGLSQYGTEEQVTSITQFSDVQPTDWAYQALSNLIERYGCVAGYPNGTYRGNRAMTRYEAAALLNACLDRITEVTDELKRLMKEFERELAVLRGRVDGLEARVGELEATQFSTTTKLRGQATFVLGANAFTGTSTQNAALPFNNNYNRANYGATVFNYDVRLNFDTSFTGKDLLRTTLRADNFYGQNGVGASPYSAGLTFLEVATNAPTQNNVVEVNRLFYNFPLGKSFSVNVGARVRMDDAGMLGMWPSVYPADSVLDVFTYAGAPGAYNTSYGLGAGAGIVYNDVLGAKGWTLSTNYVSANGGNGSPTFGVGSGGIANDTSQSTSVTQLGYTGGKFPVIGGSAWGLAAAYAYSQNMPLSVGTPYANAISAGTSLGETSSNNVGISGYWVPENTGWIPSVSTGWGASTFTRTYYSTTQAPQAQSWYVGLQWPDTFVKGNDLGMAVGQAPFVTKTGGGSVTNATGIATPIDSNYAWEWWYKFQVTDNITVTPAIYYIQNYDGQFGKTNTSTGARNATDNVFGGLLKTTFKF